MVGARWGSRLGEEGSTQRLPHSFLPSPRTVFSITFSLCDLEQIPLPLRASYVVLRL